MEPGKKRPKNIFRQILEDLMLFLHFESFHIWEPVVLLYLSSQEKNEMQTA